MPTSLPATDVAAVAAPARRHIPPVLYAVGAWAAVRLIGLAAIAVAGHQQGKSLAELLTSSDGNWYVGIATGGYDGGLHDVGGPLPQSNLAFPPLLPALIRLVMFTGLSPDTSGILVAAVAGLVAAAAIYRFGAELHGPRAGVLLTACWGALPHAVVLSMVYTEALFSAFAALFLVAIMRRQWLTAGLLAVLAGLTRPTAMVLVAVLAVMGAIAVVRRRDGWRPWAAVAVSPLGMVGHWVFVAARLGRVDGWWYVQGEGWHSHFDAGREAAWMILSKLTTTPYDLVYYVSTGVVLGCAALTLLVIRSRPPLPVVVYLVLLLVLAVGTAGTFHAKGRFLLPAFPALLPVATMLAGRRLAIQVAAVAAAVAASTAYAVYLLLVWPHSP